MSETRGTGIPLKRVQPIHRGIHDATKAYETLDIVVNASNTAAYMAVQDVPVGTALTDANYWEAIVNVSGVVDNVNSAVNANKEELQNNIDTNKKETDEAISQLSEEIDTVLFNKDNLFVDKRITTIKPVVQVFAGNEGWNYIGNGVSIAHGTQFCNVVKCVNETQSITFDVYQDMDNIGNGEYNYSFKCRTLQEGRSVSFFVIGYSTENSSGGIILDKQSHSVANTGEWVDVFGAISVPENTYNHLRIGVETYAKDMEFTEMLLVPTGSNTEFSPTKNAIYNNDVLLGKKLCVDGDSICWGHGFLGGYAKIIGENNGMTVVNNAASGATIASGVNWDSGYPRHWIAESVTELPSDGDYYIIEGGLNDYNKDVELGESSYSDIINPTAPQTITNVLNAMEYLCNKLTSVYVGKKVGFIFPHKVLSCDWTQNGMGKTHRDYKTLQKKILTKWGIPYIDLSEESNMTTAIDTIRTTYTMSGDGLHPNEIGYKQFYVDKITAWMKTL